MERREFIKHSAAIASVTAVSGISAADSIAVHCRSSIVLVDERFSDSHRFAAAYAERGAKVISLNEDIGRLWYGELRGHCLKAGAVIAGLTLHSDLFVSDRFARELKKTFQHFGTHDCRGQTTLRHTIPKDAALDLRSRETWAEHVARHLLDTSSVVSTYVTQTTRIARSSDHPGSLYSWTVG